FHFPSTSGHPQAYDVSITARLLKRSSHWNRNGDRLEITAALKPAGEDKILAVGTDHSDRVYTQLMLNKAKENRELFLISFVQNPEVYEAVISSQEADLKSVVEQQGFQAALELAADKGIVAPYTAQQLDIICQVVK